MLQVPKAVWTQRGHPRTQRGQPQSPPKAIVELPGRKAVAEALGAHAARDQWPKGSAPRQGAVCPWPWHSGWEGTQDCCETLPSMHPKERQSPMWLSRPVCG